MLPTQVLTSGFIPGELLKALRVHQNTPNLNLITVPLDIKTEFELWTPKANPRGIRLSPIEGELWQKDSIRINQIVAKMMWLMGVICLTEEDWNVGDRKPVYDWPTLLEFVKREGRCKNPIITKIIYHPHSFVCIEAPESRFQRNIPPSAWEVSPSHWSIVFEELIKTYDGYMVKATPNWLTVDIWTGKPIRRNTRTGEFEVIYSDRHTTKRL